MSTATKHRRLLSPRVPSDEELLERYRPGLEQELSECLRAMAHNEMLFNLETEPDLVEQRIYERCALLSRYRYLLQKARAVGLRTVLRSDDLGG